MVYAFISLLKFLPSGSLQGFLTQKIKLENGPLCLKRLKEAWETNCSNVVWYGDVSFVAKLDATMAFEAFESN